MKSGVKTVVNTANINRQDKDIYIYLFNIYKEQIEKTQKWSDRIKTISNLKENEDYQKMNLESQDKLFMELLSVNLSKK